MDKSEIDLSECEKIYTISKKMCFQLGPKLYIVFSWEKSWLYKKNNHSRNHDYSWKYLVIKGVVLQNIKL